MIFTDRSRWAVDQQCRRKRFYEYNSGPYGLGVRPRRQHLPLATGTGVHEPLAELLRSLKRTGVVPSREEAREIIANAAAAYRQSALSGFIGEESEHLSYVIAEQSCLLEGLSWCFWADRLPWIAEHWEILEVEEEGSSIAGGCTCGAGEAAPLEAHVAAECSAVALMIRPDFIIRDRQTGMIATADFKSSAYELDRQQYEHAPQMALSGLAAEARYGEPIPHYWLIGLLKGKRDFASKAERETKGSLKKQQSVLCYGWYRSGGPGESFGEFRFEYTREKGFGKVPVWEMPAMQEGVGPTETWVLDMLPAEIRRLQTDPLGPCNREVGILPSLLRQISLREAQVAAAMWSLREGADEASILDEFFPQNWNACYDYRRECEFRGACTGREGWDAQMVTRKPHHAEEMKLAAAWGVSFEAQEDGEAEA